MAIAHQIERLSLRIYPEQPDMAQGAVDFVVSYLGQLLSEGGSARIILASGGSQMQFLQALTKADLPWPQITAFHLDEYLGLAANHPASFRNYMQELVADRVPLGQFHYLDGETLEPLGECRRYAQLLAAQPIDLCLLGVGDNGHLAFNDPAVANFQDPDPVKIIKLAEKSRQQQVDGGFFAQLTQVPQYAITLTLATIAQARCLVCLAPGPRKAAIVQRLLTEPIGPQLPATLLRQHPQAQLFLDTAAAALLEP
jgi:glucosamine-6-phosphate deaminase